MSPVFCVLGGVGVSSASCRDVGLRGVRKCDGGAAVLGIALVGSCRSSHFTHFD